MALRMPIDIHRSGVTIEKWQGIRRPVLINATAMPPAAAAVMCIVGESKAVVGAAGGGRCVIWRILRSRIFWASRGMPILSRGGSCGELAVNY